MLIVICGLPGTGKSTLAKAIAERISAIHLSSDSIRMKMLKERTYSEKEKGKVYDEMFKEAEKGLASGKAVILDATFYKKELIEKAKEIASGAGSSFFVVECITNERVIKERIFNRKKEKSESEADFEVYKKVKEQFEKIEEKHIEVDTSLPIEKQLRIALSYIE